MSNTSDQLQSPPQGDFEKAEKYISKLVSLMGQMKVIVHNTDLSQFDPSALKDHYRVDLEDYQIEVSHSKNPNSGDDAYVMIFTNLKKIQEEVAQSGAQECTKKIILAYTKLHQNQFQKFKSASQAQLAQIKKEEEEKKFNEAIKPIDELLTKVDSDESPKPEVFEKPKQDTSNPFSDFSSPPAQA